MSLSVLRAAATTVLVYLLHPGLVVPPRALSDAYMMACSMVGIAPTDKQYFLRCVMNE